MSVTERRSYNIDKQGNMRVINHTTEGAREELNEHYENLVPVRGTRRIAALLTFERHENEGTFAIKGGPQDDTLEAKEDFIFLLKSLIADLRITDRSEPRHLLPEVKKAS